MWESYLIILEIRYIIMCDALKYRRSTIQKETMIRDTKIHQTLQRKTLWSVFSFRGIEISIACLIIQVLSRSFLLHAFWLFHIPLLNYAKKMHFLKNQTTPLTLHKWMKRRFNIIFINSSDIISRFYFYHLILLLVSSVSLLGTKSLIGFITPFYIAVNLNIYI